MNEREGIRLTDGGSVSQAVSQWEKRTLAAWWDSPQKSREARGIT